MDAHEQRWERLDQELQRAGVEVEPLGFGYCIPLAVGAGYLLAYVQDQDPDAPPYVLDLCPPDDDQYILADWHTPADLARCAWHLAARRRPAVDHDDDRPAADLGDAVQNARQVIEVDDVVVSIDALRYLVDTLDTACTWAERAWTRMDSCEPHP